MPLSGYGPVKITENSEINISNKHLLFNTFLVVVFLSSSTSFFSLSTVQAAELTFLVFFISILDSVKDVCEPPNSLAMQEDHKIIKIIS